MNPKIKEAVQRGKTCAPAKCGDENICFTLATEVERLCAELEQITISQPGYETSPPAWEKDILPYTANS